MDYIEANLADNISYDEIAASLCYPVLRSKGAVNEQNRSFVSHRAGAARQAGGTCRRFGGTI
ncbi:hypothetical protein J40TS1_39970 [Paenibacillus montaniterrae]|uniref:Uncharacterized protein n=1 Tax=Paenibacillus montaniterrae TaxID=429341 RepID=A0A919YRZ3_9BACL|nr:hypothetical protein J40TS1_39970 [Paenibacillus montaniterrae]